MKIVITGATGFIGSKLLTSLLSSGHDVIALGRSSGQDFGNFQFKYLKYIIGDKLPEELISFAPEVLIHLAWEGIPDFSLEMCLKNVNDQARFIDEIGKLDSIKKVIATGTCMEYGNKTGMCSVSERNIPHSYFSWAKQTISDLFKIACVASSTKLVWFRVFYVYGPGQRSASLISTLINKFSKGDRPILNNPFVSNDYIYINDVIDAFLLAINDPNAEGIFNIGSGSMTPAYRISGIVEKLITGQNAVSKGFELGMQSTPDPGFYAEIHSAESELGWIPKWNLNDGIAETYNSVSA